MSTLQQSIKQRRAAEFPVLECVTITAQVPGVVVSVWDGDCWVLPWSYLASACLSHLEDDEMLVLTFSGHVVTAEGRNLQPVLGEIAGFRVARLSNFPASYAARFTADVPFIGQLTVRPATSADQTRESPKLIRDSA